MRREPDDFFLMKKPYRELLHPSEFFELTDGREKADIANLLYRPDKLESKNPPQKWVIRNKSFCNVSFSKTQLCYLEFSDCRFKNCLFIGTLIHDCRFNDCSFVDCNFYRSQFQNCFIDPQAFERCLNPKKYANIGVGLYQELLHNSRQQSQPEHASHAQFQFARWKRYLKWDEIKTSDSGRIKKTMKRISIFPMWLFEKTTGSGMRLSNLAFTSIIILFLITLLNYFLCSAFGLTLGAEPVKSLTEAFYFSTIVVTSLGFGDITPSTTLGRIVVALEAIVGFLTFALLVSMAFRKITS